MQLIVLHDSRYAFTRIDNARLIQVVLYFKPLDEGQVILRGVTIEVLSLVTLCKVDKWGRGVFVG